MSKIFFLHFLLILLLSSQNLMGQVLRLDQNVGVSTKGDCSQNALGGDPAAGLGIVDTMAPITSMANCSNVKLEPYSRFASSNCFFLKECSKHKFRNTKLSLEYASIVPKILGEDFAEMSLTDHLKEMEKVEALKRYAEKKFKDLIPQSCAPTFNYDSKNAEDKKSCRAQLMDEGFSRLEKKCIDMPNCYNYNNAYDNFQSNHNFSIDGESKVHQFFSKRTEASLQQVFQGEERATKELISIMTSKLSPEVKLQKFYAKLGELKSKGQLDPALLFDDTANYYDSEHLNSSKHYAFFSKLFSKPLKENEAREQFLNYRKDYAQKALEKSCKETPTFMDICKKATDVSSGKKIYLAERESTFAIEQYASLDRIEAMQKIIPGMSNADYNIYMNAKRCEIFSLDTKRESDMKSKDSEFLSSYNEIDQALIASSTSSSLPLSGLSIGSSSMGASSVISSQSASVSEISSKGQISHSETESKAIPEEKSEDKTEVTPAESSSAFSEFAKDQNAAYQASQNNFPTSNYNQFNPSVSPDTKNPSAQVTAPTAIGGAGSGVSANVNDRIADLTKRLSVAEENVAKMKAEKVEEEKQREQDQKLAAEKAKVAELTKQIAEVKAQAQRVKSEAASANPRSAASSLNSGAVQAFSPTPVSRSGSFQDQNMSMNQPKKPLGETTFIQPTIQAAPQISASVAGPAVARAGSTGASAESPAQKLVLTGLSPEKAAEAISAKILSMPPSALLSGAVLDVEEGGVWKQIIPLVVDGKVKLDELGRPMYEKVVRKKIAKVADKSRAPASVVDAADLRKLDEERLKKERSRAEYLKLKKLTEEARDKK